MFYIDIRKMMDFRKDDIIALVTGIDDIRIIENLHGIFYVTRQECT